jgi:hypothetical protein
MTYSSIFNLSFKHFLLFLFLIIIHRLFINLFYPGTFNLMEHFMDSLKMGSGIFLYKCFQKWEHEK